MAKTYIHLQDDYRAEITSRQHTWIADEPLDAGGTDTAPHPGEMLRGALGACMAITIKMYADRKKWPLESVDVNLEIERFNASDYPAYEGDAPIVHEVREHITLHGPLTDDQRARLLEIATKCPVRRILTSPLFFVEATPEIQPNE